MTLHVKAAKRELKRHAHNAIVKMAFICLRAQENVCILYVIIITDITIRTQQQNASFHQIKKSLKFKKEFLLFRVILHVKNAIQSEVTRIQNALNAKADYIQSKHRHLLFTVSQSQLAMRSIIIFGRRAINSAMIAIT